MTARAVIEVLPQAQALDSQGDDPTQAHPLVEKWQSDVALCRVLAAGTRELHKQRLTYLPSHPAEDPDDYNRRAQATELFNGFGQCIKASTGMIFSTDPSLEEGTAAPFKEVWEDIDGQGTHAVVFLRRVTEDALAAGIAAIFVDYPDVQGALGGRRPNYAEERQLRLRPYWCHLRREQLKSWDWERIGGKTYLSHLVVQEQVTGRTGRFKIGTQIQLRVFTRTTDGQVFWAIWQKRVIQGQEKWVVTRSGFLANQTEIPVSFVVMGPQAGMLDAAPPLLDLAWVNLSHWRLLTDRRYVMHLSCVPSLVLEGFQQLQRDPGDQAGDPNQQRMVIGPGVVIRVPKDGKAYYLEPGGTSLAATAEELKQLELRMVALGLTFMFAETRAAESAEAKRIDARAQWATLATCARALQDGAAQALIYTGAYLELPAPNVAVRQDFSDTTLDVSMAGFVLQMNQASALSRRTMYDLLKRGSVLPADFDEEEEEKRLVEEALARAATVEDPNAPPPPAPGDGKKRKAPKAKQIPVGTGTPAG